MDLTRQLQIEGSRVENVNALAGIKTLSDFPGDDRCKEGSDSLLVRVTAETVFQKTASYSAKFESGEMLAAARKPTRLAFVDFAYGRIALSPDSDIMIKNVGDVVHIVNFDGRGETVKIKLAESSGSEQNAKVIALAPGYELVVGNRVLKHHDVRIADGCARRHFKMLDNGKIAVCEISTESVLTRSAVVAELKPQEADKERRILADMSKMAAVLNYVNGTNGFKADAAPSTVANK